MTRVVSALTLLLMFGLELGTVGAPVALAHPVAASPGAGTSTSCPASTINTGGPRCGDGPVVLSSAEQVILAKKQAPADEFVQVRAGKLALSTFQRDSQAFLQLHGGTTHGAQPAMVPNGCVGNCPPLSYSFTMLQQAQTTTYYCGPASAAEALSARSIWVSQATLAGSSYLNTSPIYGTNWGDNVMAPTLNHFTGSSFYTTVNATAGMAAYENDLTADIYSGWPTVMGIAEYANNGPHLNGHPTDKTIYHWIAAHGYSSSGANTIYDDSIAGDTQFWSWAVNVPASSSIISANLFTMMSQGGYGWVW